MASYNQNHFTYKVTIYDTLLPKIISFNHRSQNLLGICLSSVVSIARLDVLEKLTVRPSERVLHTISISISSVFVIRAVCKILVFLSQIDVSMSMKFSSGITNNGPKIYQAHAFHLAHEHQPPSLKKIVKDFEFMGHAQI